MKNPLFDMTELFHISEWEAVCDQLAKMSGMAIISIDHKGTPVTRHSMRTAFCSCIRESAISCKRCNKCDALAGLEAVRQNRPFIYLCHCGIVDAAVPVVVGDRYIGAVMMGEVRIAQKDNHRIDRLISEISSFQPESSPGRADLADLYRQLPEYDYGRIEASVQMVASLVRYIVDEAVRRRLEKMNWEWLFEGRTPAGPAAFGLPGEDAGPEALSAPDVPESRRIDPAPSLPVSCSSPVYPAVLYIENHPELLINTKKMAELCHLNAQYFSRLFQRELKENYIDYLHRRKICWAKQQLAISGKSIYDIAISLGYADASYFIKIFKKYEGITPLQCRRREAGKYSGDNGIEELSPPSAVSF